MKEFRQKLLISCCILIVTGEYLYTQVIPGKEWISFYSANTFYNGSLVEAGTIISVYDGDGRLCGIDTVTINGHYGFLPVYRDDPTTPDLDEGAEPGDTLQFSINGSFARPASGKIPVWTSNGDRFELDLEAWSNWPPVISEIPDHTIFEGEGFNPISLNDFISDPDHSDDQLTWTCSGNSQLSILIADHIATINTPNENWFGSESVAFRATDPEGLFAEDSVRFTAIAVNDTPVIDDIKDQLVFEDEGFNPISLNEFINDPDHSDDQLTWSFSKNSQLSIILTNHIATINTPNENWFGSESVAFRATDPEGLFAEDSVRFTAIAVNDTPVVSKIPDQHITDLETFRPIKLDEYVDDVDDTDEAIRWSIIGNQHFIITIENRIAEIKTPDDGWTGSETILFTATDRGLLSDSTSAVFTVLDAYDSPVIDSLPIINFKEDHSLTIADSHWYDFVEDPFHADSLLHFRIDSGAFVYADAKIDSISFGAKENWFGSDSLYFLVTDGGHYSSSYLLINVLPVNDAPVIDLPDTILIENDATIQIRLWDYVEDIESQDSLLQYNFFSNIDLITWDYHPASGMLEVSLNYQYTGSCDFIVSVVDDSGAGAVDSVIISVENPLTDISLFPNHGKTRHFSLAQNYPNPFNTRTTFQYSLPRAGYVELSIFDTVGKKVLTLVSKFQQVGSYEVDFDASALSSGTYFYQLRMQSHKEVRKLLYLK